MSVSPAALAWARARARGPVRRPAGTPAPEGVTRLVEPDGGQVWLVTVPPPDAGPAAVEELGLAVPGVEQPNDTARVLAAVLRCCWTDPTGPVWPGEPAAWGDVLAVFGGWTDRDPATAARAAVGGVRRLHGAGWVLWDERARTVRIGPRVASWTPADLTVLRELHRRIEPPARPAPDVPEDPDAGGDA